MKKSSTYNLKTAKLPDAATFAGIDYHKKFFVVSFGDADGNLLAQIKRMSTQENVREVFLVIPAWYARLRTAGAKNGL